MAAPSTRYMLYIDDEHVDDYLENDYVSVSAFTPSSETGKTFSGFVFADGLDVGDGFIITETTYLYTKWSYNTVAVDGQYLADIADAIRSKNGQTTKYTPPQMSSAISDLPVGGDIQIATGTSESVMSKIDLPFTPRYVEIMAMYDESGYSVSSGTNNYLISARFGNLNGNNFNEYMIYRCGPKQLVGKTNTMFSVSCDMSENAFNFSSNGTMYFTDLPVTYSYIAIG